MNAGSHKKKTMGIDWDSVRGRMEEIRAGIERGQVRSEMEKGRILKQRARTLAKEPLRPETGEFIDVITFLLADEKYGIESSFVEEVYALKDLTPIPCTPDFVLGVTSVRGKIVSVIDIKKFFGLPAKGLNELDKIVLVSSNGIEVGIWADYIVGVRSIAAAEIQPPLPMLTGIREKYLKGITSDRLVILDAGKLLSDPEIIVNEEVED